MTMNVSDARTTSVCPCRVSRSPASTRAIISTSWMGKDGGERVLRTVGSPSCVAKNRYALPAELSRSWPALMQAMCLAGHDRQRVVAGLADGPAASATRFSWARVASVSQSGSVPSGEQRRPTRGGRLLNAGYRTHRLSLLLSTRQYLPPSAETEHAFAVFATPRRRI